MSYRLSYSSVKDAAECPYRFKLKVIDKIPTFQNSIDTIFGTLLHQAVQDFLLGKRDLKQTQKRFLRSWRWFYKLYNKKLSDDDKPKIAKFALAGVNIIDHIEEAFKHFETLEVEERLEMQLSDEHPDYTFKGFIDLVMKQGSKIVIADLKTTKSTFVFARYLDKIKRFQLAFYKVYYAKKHGVDLNDIELYYVTLEKTPSSKQPIRFLRESGSKALIQEAEYLLTQTIERIENNQFPKNLNSCYNPKTGIRCPFYETQHCINETTK